MDSSTTYRNTYVEVDNSIITENARIMCERYPHPYMMAVVKGNAYGHGYGIIPALIRGGINAFCVSSLDEALKVREYTKDKPVIMLEPVHDKHYKVCSANNISVCINCEETLDEAIQSNENLRVHIKVDCGMNRLGFKDKEALKKACDKAFSAKNLETEGLFSHFHTSGMSDVEYAANRKRFEELTSGLDLSRFPIVHIDKSQTVMAHDKPDYTTGVRFGIVLYGFNLLRRFDNSPRGRLSKLKYNLLNRLHHVPYSNPRPNLNLKTAISMYTEVIQVKHVAAGEYVGYGLLHKAERDEYIAVIDTGYADGINRKRPGSLVCINHKKYPIIGEIGMGMCEVLADESVKRHDRVTVVGDEIPIVHVTMHVGTTMYDLMTGINSDIPRRYINE